MSEKGTFKNSLDFSVENVTIWPAGTPTDPSKSIDMTGTVVMFSYVESITSPFVAGTLTVLDSGGLLGGLPIQGTENVWLKIRTSSEEDPITYKMKIWSIHNRYTKGQKQIYNLGLISTEAIINETVRVTKPLQGHSDSIVTELLENFFNTEKNIHTETSQFQMKLLPARRRVFDIITEVCIKSVAKVNFEKTKSKKGSKDKTEEANVTETVKGSAGFFFWENRRGFNFFAVDSLFAEKGSKFRSESYDNEAFGTYKERDANTDDIPEEDERSNILEASFGSQLNVMESLRLGKYGTLIAFFNHSTGLYEEYIYNASDNYDNMSHLGGQESIELITDDNHDLTERPSRVMSVYLDHETWYNKGWPANPEDKNAKSPTPFADWQKYYTTQALTRYEFLRNQYATIQIPGNSRICAGDTVDIRLQNKLPNAITKEEKWDRESSGIYLVEEVTHEYARLENANGRFITTLRLMRDSYGMKGRISSHGK